MPLPQINGCYRTITNWTNIPAGNPFSVVLDFQETSGGTYSAESVAEALENAWRDLYATVIGGSGSYASRISDEVSLNQITVYDLGSNAAPVISTVTPQITGTGTAIPLPPDVALCVTKRTATRGRAGRGRMYLGGFTTNAVSANGTLAMPGLTDALNLGFLRIFDDLENGYDMVVISQATDPNGVARTVTNLTVDTNWDTQRRRGN